MSSRETTTNASNQHKHPLEWCKYSRRVALKSILSRPDGGLGLVGERVIVGGWVMSFKEKEEEEDSTGVAAPVVQDLTCFQVLMACMPLLRCVLRAFRRGCASPEASRRKSPARVVKMVACLRINDGSCVANLQVVMDSSMSLINQVLFPGSSILVEGSLQQSISVSSSSSSSSSSTTNHHVVVLKAEKILHVGSVDSKTYPLAKKNSSLEFIRDFPHLRPRTKTIASITRIRNTITYSTHIFFQKIGFININTPIITSNAWQNHSKTFQLAALLTKPNDAETLLERHSEKEGEGKGEAITIDVLKAAVREKKDKIEELKRSDSNREALLAALLDLQKANEIALRLEKKGKMEGLDQGSVDMSKDFFACKAYLVSSSLLGFHLESFACGLGSVYAVAPVFHAAGDDKKLAELWMVEVEVAFSELEDVMNCAEEFIKFLTFSVLESCFNELKFLSKWIDKHCIERLQSTMSTSFARITYSQALEDLKQVIDKAFETKAEWGVNLSEEHKRYLCEEIYKRPIIIYDYPKEMKPFYVHIKDDGRTASAFDIIAPKVGVLVQGSKKEEHLNVITSRIQELGLEKKDYEWYFDLRKHGTVKHCGFSLGIEDIVMFATGIEDARDVIPFPRTYGHLKA